MKNNRLLIAIAFLCAVAAIIAAVTIIKSYLQLERVVVTARNILPGEVLSEKDVKFEDIPARLVPTGMATDIPMVAGKTSTSYLAAGSPIPQSLLMPSQAAGIAGKLKSYPGRRAIGIEANIATTAGYSIREGNRVDIVAVPKQGAIAPATVARDVPVLSAPSSEQQQSSAVALALMEQEIFSVVQAKAHGDVIQIALEPAN